VKNSRVWEAREDTDEENDRPILGRLLAASAKDALRDAREYWPNADTIRVDLVRRKTT
jgi:hypothetical protein